MKVLITLWEKLKTPPGLWCDKRGANMHEWRSPAKHEKFPVCIYCGKTAWYLRGYTTNMGTYYPPDINAQRLMEGLEDNLSDIPFNSRP